MKNKLDLMNIDLKKKDAQIKSSNLEIQIYQKEVFALKRIIKGINEVIILKFKIKFESLKIQILKKITKEMIIIQ